MNLRSATEVDVTLDCDCGISFRIYIPETPYECPECQRTYEVSLTVKEVNKNESEWKLVGHVEND